MMIKEISLIILIVFPIVIIAKQRNGPVDEFPLVWLPEYTKFANMSKDEKERLKSHSSDE